MGMLKEAMSIMKMQTIIRAIEEIIQGEMIVGEMMEGVKIMEEEIIERFLYLL